jgi:hypothetical protein
MNSITGLSARQLRKAANIKEKIDSLQNDLNRLLGGEVSATPPAKGGRKRKMSAAGRAAIAAAARARWAKLKGTTTAAKPARKRKMSAAGRAAISAAAKARWAKLRAAKKSKLG